MALPQYQKAVEKSRQVEAWSMMKKIIEAAQWADMEELGGEYTFADLPFEFLKENGTPATAGSSFDTKNWFFGNDSRMLGVKYWARAIRKNGPFDYGLSLNHVGDKYCFTFDNNAATTCPKAGARNAPINCPFDPSMKCYPF